MVLHISINFQVYLKKAETDLKTYVGWLCAGVIMAPDLVLTSAACVEDVQNLYVIAGYEKYVQDEVRDDECVETMLKKVVHICVPRGKYFRFLFCEREVK